MRFVIFGLTVSSSWGNGHATLWRGLWRALARGVIASCRRGPRANCALRTVAIVTSYCPDGVAATGTRRVAPHANYHCELSYLGTYAADRQRHGHPHPTPGLFQGTAAGGLPDNISFPEDGLCTLPADEYIRALVNAYIQGGGRAIGVRTGSAYVDVGTVHGYREALGLLSSKLVRDEPAGPRPTTICSHPGTPFDKEPSVASSPWPPAMSACAAASPPAADGAPQTFTRTQIEQRVRELGDWFHNLDLQGVRTAPAHFLGDFPSIKWKRFAHLLPQDLRGKSVLDIGCNAGFYSFEMKRRGSSPVLGIDFDDYFLNQARFAGSLPVPVVPQLTQPLPALPHKRGLWWDTRLLPS